MNSLIRNPKLSAELAADYAALQNDLEQARCLATDYQNQLCAKSNDFAALKNLLEKTAADLEQLQANIVELREERHRLANEAMRAVALERQLADMKAERDLLRKCSPQVSHEFSPDFIHVTLEDADSVVITPTVNEPRSKRSFRRRP